MFEECSGRGACDRASGVCACFSGYEGAACGRMACPRAPRTELIIEHVDNNAQAGMKEAEMAWEAAFAGGGGEGAGAGSSSGSGGGGGNGTWGAPAASSPATAEASGASVSGFARGVLEACSGRGRCTPLGSLPSYAAGAALAGGGGGGGGDWAAARVQKCVCDEGWSGPDCSQRTCPHGVSIEALRSTLSGGDNGAVCAWDAEDTSAAAAAASAGDGAPPPLPVPTRTTTVFRLELAFPLPPDATGKDWVAAGSDDLVLTACHGPGGRRTPAIPGMWSSASTPSGHAAAAARLRDHLLSIPCMAHANLTVAPAADNSGSGGTTSRAYALTFAPPGPAPPLACPPQSGCSASGCSPPYRQLRALKAPSPAPTWLGVAESAVLRTPPLPVPPPAQPAWGASATLVLSRGWGGRALYRWEGMSAWGGDALTLEEAQGAGSGVYEVVDTPLPPGALREGLAGPFGLRLNVSEAEDLQVLADLGDLGGSAGPWRLTYSWSLPACSIALVQAPTHAVAPAECSNKGVCARDTGRCSCFPGYAGRACEVSAETAVV
jgi:hypothetical protein